MLSPLLYLFRQVFGCVGIDVQHGRCVAARRDFGENTSAFDLVQVISHDFLDSTASHGCGMFLVYLALVMVQIVALKETHREWGKQRIADELMKSNGWVPVVSAGTVYNILVVKDDFARGA